MNQPMPPYKKHLIYTMLAAALAFGVAGCDDSDPTASAGLSQNVTTGTTITFDGSASTNASSYSWTLVSAPAGSTATITGANTAKPTFTPDLPGVYVGKVTVSDGSNTAEATVTVTASDVVGFDLIPATPPPFYRGYSFQATASNSIGDQISLKAGTPRTLAGFKVGMSSYACETGQWTGGCMTTPGTSFQHPVTVNFYNNAGTLLATKTQTFTMPHRPSADPTCADTKMYKAANGTCYNGLAFYIDFDVRSLKVALPDSFYYTLSMNTATFGTAPIGVPGNYDNINVGTNDTERNAAFVGSDPKPDVLLFDGVEDTGDPSLISRVLVQAP